MSRSNVFAGESLITALQREKLAIFNNAKLSQDEQQQLWTQQRTAIESYLANDLPSPQIVKAERTVPMLSRIPSQVCSSRPGYHHIAPANRPRLRMVENAIWIRH
jgi:hypothetical protein